MFMFFFLLVLCIVKSECLFRAFCFPFSSLKLHVFIPPLLYIYIYIIFDRSWSQPGWERQETAAHMYVSKRARASGAAGESRGVSEWIG